MLFRHQLSIYFHTIVSTVKHFHTQMWTNVPRTTGDAVNLLLVPTYLTASHVPVLLDTPAMDLPAQVRQSFRQPQAFA